MGNLHLYVECNSCFSSQHYWTWLVESSLSKELWNQLFMLKFLWPHSQKPTVSDICSKCTALKRMWYHTWMASPLVSSNASLKRMSVSSPRPEECTACIHLISSRLNFLSLIFKFYFLSTSCHVLSLQKTGCHLHSWAMVRFLLNCKSYAVWYHLDYIGTGLIFKVEAYYTRLGLALSGTWYPRRKS